MPLCLSLYLGRKPSKAFVSCNDCKVCFLNDYKVTLSKFKAAFRPETEFIDLFVRLSSSSSCAGSLRPQGQVAQASPAVFVPIRRSQLLPM